MPKRKAGQACHGRNHLGKQKTRHTSRNAALRAIIRRHMGHGMPCRIYRCPTAPGIYHVTTDRKQTP